MKLMIASDIHGSEYYCEKMLSQFQKEAPERLILLGDLLYHGPRNDLPKGYRPKGVISMLNEVKARLCCVRGNCDCEVDQMVLEFPILADYLLLYLNGRMVFATHGHIYNNETPPALSPGDVLLNGHTHIPSFTRTQAGYYYLNPGSVSLPKNQSERGYMVYEEGVYSRKSLDGVILDELAL